MRGRAMPWNHKRVYRIYIQMNLNIRRKPKRRLPFRTKEALYHPDLPNRVWSMDFMFDRLTNGRSFRTLNILDDFNREIVNIVVDTSISSARVARELSQVLEWRGKPNTIRVDNGPEFLALKPWCESNGIELKFIQPGKPNQMRISNVSTELIVTKCWVPTYSKIYIRLGLKQRNLSGSIII